MRKIFNSIFDLEDLFKCRWIRKLLEIFQRVRKLGNSLFSGSNIFPTSKKIQKLFIHWSLLSSNLRPNERNSTLEELDDSSIYFVDHPPETLKCKLCEAVFRNPVGQGFKFQNTLIYVQYYFFLKYCPTRHK